MTQRELPKLIAFDLDGTVLNLDGSIGRKTAEALREAKRRGCVLVISTGRSRAQLSSKMLAQCGADYVVSSNGACITGPGGKVMYYGTLDSCVACEIAADAQGCGAYAEIMSAGRPVAEWRLFKLLREKREGLMHPPFLVVARLMLIVRWVNSVCQYIKKTGLEPEKLVCLFADAKTREERQAKYLDKYAVEVASTYGRDLEITSGGVTKGNALLRIAEWLDIPMARVAAIGDSGNDLSMRVAGTLVAMENGDEELKAHADFLAPPVYLDGVAEALRSIFQIDWESAGEPAG